MKDCNVSDDCKNDKFCDDISKVLARAYLMYNSADGVRETGKAIESLMGNDQEVIILSRGALSSIVKFFDTLADQMDAGMNGLRNSGLIGDALVEVSAN